MFFGCSSYQQYQDWNNGPLGAEHSTRREHVTGGEVLQLYKVNWTPLSALLYFQFLFYMSYKLFLTLKNLFMQLQFVYNHWKEFRLWMVPLRGQLQVASMLTVFISRRIG